MVKGKEDVRSAGVEQGFMDVVVMPASFQGWKDAGLPTEEE